jgi:hypothetical protein
MGAGQANEAGNQKSNSKMKNCGFGLRPKLFHDFLWE